ncbi:MAG: NfeD family protein [Alphaproteobacteria bacterium]
MRKKSTHMTNTEVGRSFILGPIEGIAMAVIYPFAMCIGWFQNRFVSKAQISMGYDLAEEDTATVIDIINENTMVSLYEYYVRYQGEIWKSICHDEPLAIDEEVRVTQRDGITLIIKRSENMP